MNTKEIPFDIVIAGLKDAGVIHFVSIDLIVAGLSPLWP